MFEFDLILSFQIEALVASLLGKIILSGAHEMISSGGADIPVIITVLNSYSGWALCAEGYISN